MKNLDESLFDFDHNLVNVSNAILSHYGVAAFHRPHEGLLSCLKGHRKVAVFLFDGLGKEVLLTHKKASKDFLARGLFPVLSVNPATTVAATTSFLTGKYPIETGYLGWSLYFDDLGFPIDVFPNINSLTKEKLRTKDYMNKRCPTKKLDVLLEEKGVKTKLLFPYPIDERGPKTLEEEFQAANVFYKEGGEFLYFYSPEPDHTLHEEGFPSKNVSKFIKRITKLLLKFSKENPDVLILSLADHGMTNVMMRDLAAYPDLLECLRRPLTFEGRTVNFFIKEDKKEYFEDVFQKRFNTSTLLKREEILSSHYFGLGEPSKMSLSFLGDYIALSRSNETLENSSDKKIDRVKGHHAGICPEEREILLCRWDK